MKPSFSVLWIFLFLAFRAGAQVVPAYQGKSPLVHDKKVYLNQISLDSNQTLVNLDGYIPHVRLDIRYATNNNFMHARMYPEARAFLRLPAARALKNIAMELSAEGIGLVIYDAYRPYSITVQFYKKVMDSAFVASPRNGSKHNRGCAVDLGLYSLKTGEILEMPTGFDSFSKEAAAHYSGASPRALKDRELLANTMEKYGFETIATEWWHFDYKAWRLYPVMDISFSELHKIKHKIQ